LDNNGNLYIADSEHNRILKLNLNSGVFTTVAGKTNKRGYTGESGIASSSTLVYPRAIAIDKEGNIFILDGNCLRKISKQ
jgi:sugar lactone lactonase YvrE